jgi:hypothetical protein
MSVDDLGGETVVHYAPSTNVMDALEAFRNEETEAEEAGGQAGDAGTLFGKKSKKIGKNAEVKATIQAEGLPDLDERSRALASIAMPRKAPASARKRSRYTTDDYIRYGGIAVVSVIVMYLAIFQAPGWWEALTYEPPVQFTSRVSDLQRDNAPAVEVLAAAVEAERAVANDQHVADLSHARGKVKDEVRELLNAMEWERSLLERAAQIASRAATVDSGTEIQKLKQLVDKEVRLYNVRLTKINPDRSSATFSLTGSGVGQATIPKGGSLAGRFSVDGILVNEVRLIDTARGGRVLKATIGQAPR